MGPAVIRTAPGADRPAAAHDRRTEEEGAPMGRRAALDRRWIAAAGLLAVLIATVVLGAASKRYPGTAQAGPPAPPPRIGDCLLTTPPADAGAGASFAGLLGPCGADRGGEVVALLSDTSGAYRSDDPPLQTCATAARQYLGLDADGGVDGLESRWTPAPSFGVAVVAPTARQRVAGQRWGACVAYVNAWQGSPAVIRPVRYQGTLLHSFSTGEPPTAMGVCGTARTLAAPSDPTWYVACAGAHNREVLAYRSPINRPPDENRSALEDANAQGLQDLTDCEVLASRFLHRSDPTVGHQLQVVPGPVAIVDGDGGGSWASVADSGAYSGTVTITVDGGSACLLAPADGSRQLGGSLLGLGDAAVPWA
jgi:hypothetical protein